MGNSTSTPPNCEACGVHLRMGRRHRCRRCQRQLCVDCSMPLGDIWVCKKLCTTAGGGVPGRPAPETSIPPPIQPTPSSNEPPISVTTVLSMTTTTAPVAKSGSIDAPASTAATSEAKLEGGSVHQTPVVYVNQNAAVTQFSPTAQVAFTPLNATSLSSTPSSFLSTRTSSGDGSGSAAGGISPTDSNLGVLPNTTSTPAAPTSTTSAPVASDNQHSKTTQTNSSTNLQEAVALPATLHAPGEAEAKESKMEAEPKKGKSEALSDLRSNLIHFSWIPHKWLIVSELMLQGVSTDDEGPVHALHACLKLLKNLYYFDALLLDDELSTRWRNVRDRIRIGLIKDTKQHGNTSVSMGAAKNIDFGEYVGLLNCGTGGIKYQLYAKRNGMLYLKAEFKPKSGASPNALMGVGSYSPKKGGVSFERTEELLRDELNHSDLPWGDKPNIPVYAFVTGTIRQYWEEADVNEKAVMEGVMENLFAPHGISMLNSGSYFMTQEAEGHLELVGSKEMYDNLSRDHLLDAGTTVVGSFGIGRGSCQWMMMIDGQPELIAHKAGMTNLEGLANVGKTVIDEYRNNQPKFLRFLEALERIEFPVFALKSGCALLLENKNYSYVKAQLMAPVSVVPEKTVNIARNGSSEVVECTFAGSKDLLCALGGLKLGEVDLETVYHSDGRRVMTSEEIVAGDYVYYLAPLRGEFKQSAESVPSTEQQPPLTTTEGDQNASLGSDITQPESVSQPVLVTADDQNASVGLDITQQQSGPAIEQQPALTTTEGDQNALIDSDMKVDTQPQETDLGSLKGSEQEQRKSLHADDSEGVVPEILTRTSDSAPTGVPVEEAANGDAEPSEGNENASNAIQPQEEVPREDIQPQEEEAPGDDTKVPEENDVVVHVEGEGEGVLSVGAPDISIDPLTPSIVPSTAPAATTAADLSLAGSDQIASVDVTSASMDSPTPDQIALVSSDVKADIQPQETDSGSTQAPEQEENNEFVHADPEVVPDITTVNTTATPTTLDSVPMGGPGDNGDNEPSNQAANDGDQNASNAIQPQEEVPREDIQPQEEEAPGDDTKVPEENDVVVHVEGEGEGVSIVLSVGAPDISIDPLTPVPSMAADAPPTLVSPRDGPVVEETPAGEVKQPEGKMEKRKEDYSNDLISLEAVIYKWLLTTRLMRKVDLSDDDKGPVHALHATLVLLKNLWYLDHFLPADLGEKWRTLRSRVRIGLIKDTKKYGNTSVSMGAATTVSFTTSVGFLNCGTGGIKYQLYTLKNGILFLEAEYKPKNGASPNAMLGLGAYKPKGEGVTLVQTQALLAEELQNAPWALKEGGQSSDKIPVYAFVTGTVRQFWEECKSPEQRAELESGMQALFEPHGIQKLKDSYFMPQDVEGDLELLGSRAMYANLEQAGLLPKGTTVVGSSGIGRGSCQWMVMGKGGEAQLIGHKAGMTNLPELANLGEKVISTYASDNERATFLMESLEAVQFPVLALKSGCALLLENKNYAYVKAELVAPISVGTEVAVRVAKKNSPKFVKCFWRGSLSLFCAEAAFALELPHENFEIVYLSSTGDEIVSDFAEITSDELLFVASWNETDAALL